MPASRFDYNLWYCKILKINTSILTQLPWQCSHRNKKKKRMLQLESLLWTVFFKPLSLISMGHLKNLRFRKLQICVDLDGFWVSTQGSWRNDAAEWRVWVCAGWMEAESCIYSHLYLAYILSLMFQN